MAKEIETLEHRIAEIAQSSVTCSRTVLHAVINSSGVARWFARPSASVSVCGMNESG